MQPIGRLFFLYRGRNLHLWTGLCHCQCSTLYTLDLNVFFTEDDYRAPESALSVPVRITKDRRIATSVTLQIHPVTLMQAEQLGETIPEQMPDDDPFSPNRAGTHTHTHTHKHTHTHTHTHSRHAHTHTHTHTHTACTHIYHIIMLKHIQIWLTSITLQSQ